MRLANLRVSYLGKRAALMQCRAEFRDAKAPGENKGIPEPRAARIERMLGVLDACAKPADMALPGFKFHELKGDRKGTYCIAVTGNHRITLQFEGEDATNVDLEDYH